MLEYTVLQDYGASVKIKFNKCGHEVSINKEHFNNNEFTCNKCSNLYEWDYFYDTYNGLQHKSELTRKCKVCNQEDKMSNLIPIKKNVKNGIHFWFYHKECLEKYGYNKKSVEELLNNPEIKNKKIPQPQQKSVNLQSTKLQRRRLPKISKAILNKRNIEKIENNYGININFDTPIPVFNKTYYNISNIKGLYGIYSIHNIKTNKRYIGSTKDLRTRFLTHYNCLIKNKHSSYKLQEDFNKYNINDFEFEILEILDDDINNNLLHLTEQKYIDIADSYNNGYNVTPIAGFYGSATDYYKLINNL